MDLWQKSFNEALIANQNNTAFFENQKQAYLDLSKNLNSHSEKLSVPILVPISSRILMKGKLVHTNEVLVSLGSNYFVKSSAKDAQDICRRRLNEVEKNLRDLEKENDFLTNQVEFSQKNILTQDCEEIIEEYNEEQEKVWREKHRENIKIHQKREMEERKAINDESIMNKLDVLELQEEIETSQNIEDNMLKESALHEKLNELREKKKTKCTTVEDIFKRLDELEEEEELEDELIRLRENSDANENKSDEDTSESEDNVIDYVNEDTDVKNEKTIKRRVSFADKESENSNTVNINFKHSVGIENKKESDKIESPSDICRIFSNLTKKNKPIIKNCHRVQEEVHNEITKSVDINDSETPLVTNGDLRKHIVIGDVIEHIIEEGENSQIEEKRPVSKFKSMRLARKSSINK